MFLHLPISMTVTSRTFRHALLIALVSVATSPLHAEEPPALDGTWQLVPAESTDSSPWNACRLTISIRKDKVTLARHFGAGRRTFEDSFTFTTDDTETIVPSVYWPENRHLGAYMSDEQQRRMRATWLDEQRILRVNTDLVLSTQQGERAVNVLSNYQVSRDGQRLTIVELRSTRTRPIVFVFSRVTSP